MQQLSSTEVAAVSGGFLFGPIIGSALLTGSNLVNVAQDLFSPLAQTADAVFGSGFARLRGDFERFVYDGSRSVVDYARKLGAVGSANFHYLNARAGQNQAR